MELVAGVVANLWAISISGGAGCFWSVEVSYYTRRFLNKKKGIASLECQFDQTTNWIDASFTLSDCHRSVTIDLHFGNKSDCREKLNKLQTIIDDLTLMHVALSNKVNDPEFKKQLK